MIDEGTLSEPALVNEVFKRAAACYTTLSTTPPPHPAGTAACAQWVVTRPELSSLGEHTLFKLQWHLGSDNFRRLLDLKRNFDGHKSGSTRMLRRSDAHDEPGEEVVGGTGGCRSSRPSVRVLVQRSGWRKSRRRTRSRRCISWTTSASSYSSAPAVQGSPRHGGQRR